MKKNAEKSGEYSFLQEPYNEVIAASIMRRLQIPHVEYSVTDFLDRLLTVDFLIANEDRHFNNFGVIRNAETLEFIGMAPIYDNGTSLWYNTPAHLIKPLSPSIPSKPFKDTHGEQISLVRSFDWLDISALNGIADEYYDLLSASEYIDPVRRDTLCDALDRRVKLLREIQNRA